MADSSPTFVLGMLPFVGLSVFLLVWSVYSLNREFLAVGEEHEEEGDGLGPLVKLALPWIRSLGAMVSSSGALPGFRRDLRRRLTAAGKSEAITSDELVGGMFLAAIIGTGLGGFTSYVLESWYEVLIPGLGLLGMMLPLMGLNDAIRRRHGLLRRELPFTLDLLTLSVEGGLDFTASLKKISDRLSKGPLQAEIRRLVREVTMGKTRSEALRAMADRNQLEELMGVVSSLVQADELGASLGPTLRIQAEEMRRKRFQAAEKKAMQAPVLMLFPLVAFIFPLVFILTFAPLAIRFMKEDPLSSF